MKIVKLKPLNEYFMQQVAVRWQSKTFCGKVAWRAETTTGLVGYPVREY